MMEVSNEGTQQITATKLAKVPTEDKWFEVNPLAIDQTIFQKARRDRKQRIHES